MAAVLEIRRSTLIIFKTLSYTQHRSVLQALFQSSVIFDNAILATRCQCIMKHCSELIASRVLHLTTISNEGEKIFAFLFLEQLQWKY